MSGIKKIFVAYPYALGDGYRAALRDRFTDSGIDFLYADDRLANKHILAKIVDMMRESDVSMFDVTGNNPNVMLELGIALGLDEPGFVAINRNAIDALSADVHGWDTLRYGDFAELAEKLHGYATQGSLPSRFSTYRTGSNAATQIGPTNNTVRQVAERNPRDPVDVLHEIHFGVPPVPTPIYCVYTVPLEYDRHYLNRRVLGKAPFTKESLIEAVKTGASRQDFFFWEGDSVMGSLDRTISKSTKGKVVDVRPSARRTSEFTLVGHVRICSHSGDIPMAIYLRMRTISKR